jgi:hypothetical protein
VKSEWFEKVFRVNAPTGRCWRKRHDLRRKSVKGMNLRKEKGISESKEVPNESAQGGAVCIPRYGLSLCESHMPEELSNHKDPLPNLSSSFSLFKHLFLLRSNDREETPPYKTAQSFSSCLLTRMKTQVTILPPLLSSLHSNVPCVNSPFITKKISTRII